MPCAPFSTNGMTGFVCGPGLKPKRCACGSGKPADLLCDWKVETKPEVKTCDAPVCRTCATHVGSDRDLCPAHARAWAIHPNNPAARDAALKDLA